MAHNDKIISMKLDADFYKRRGESKFEQQDYKKRQRFLEKCLKCHLKILMLKSVMPRV